MRHVGSGSVDSSGTRVSSSSTVMSVQDVPEERVCILGPVG
jgi:hypothetical protein